MILNKMNNDIGKPPKPIVFTNMLFFSFKYEKGDKVNYEFDKTHKAD